MDYSILADSMPQDAGGLVVDVHSVYAHLLEIPDPRKARGCRYEWALILLLIVLEKLAGEDKPRGIASLSAQVANPARLLDLVRQHWGIENGLHYRRDVTFQVDKVFVGVLVLAGAGFLLTELLNLAERRLESWRVDRR